MHCLLYRKMTIFLNGTIVDTNNLQPGELLHLEFGFYNITSIRGFTKITTVVCANKRMACIFPITSKRASFRIIRFILYGALNNR